MAKIYGAPQRRKTRIGIPKNERLYPAVEAILLEQEIGYSPPNPKQFVWETKDFKFILGGVAEIAKLTASGIFEYAFITSDYWKEWMLDPSSNPYDNLRVLKEFPSLGRCDVAFVAHEKSYWVKEPDDRGLIHSLVSFHKSYWKPTITTRFPRITNHYIYVEGSFGDVCESVLRWGTKEVKAWRYEVIIKEVRGDEEVYLFGGADIAMAHVETGETLRQNHLVPIETVFPSHLILVGSKDLPMTALF